MSGNGNGHSNGKGNGHGNGNGNGHKNGNGLNIAPVPLRVAVVGLGYWGPNLVRNLHELPEADVVAVCDADEWINGLSNPIGESYHPKATGHAGGYTPAVSPLLTGAAVDTWPDLHGRLLDDPEVVDLVTATLRAS